MVRYVAFGLITGISIVVGMYFSEKPVNLRREETKE